ncbi:MAG: transporter substrate-binding domain-containing protein [Chloroflexota bacterium]|nr:transporter substrate-binding domain-containing protein [Chloroflexota bacterium]
MIGQWTKARGLVAGALLLPALLLAGCGADAPTATVIPTAMVAPTGTTMMAAMTPTAMMAAMTPTAMMAAMTPTAMMAAMTPTAMMAAMTPTAMMADMTPTAMMAGTEMPGMMGSPTAGSTAMPPTPPPTPVSSFVPGAHKGTIPAPAKLKEAGKLTFGTDAGYPPQEYVDAAGKPVGFDMDIAAEIASRMGLELNVVNFKFDAILPALNSSQFDAVISAMTITDERAKVVDFVRYFEAGQAVLVAKGNPKGIKALEDLSGKTAVAEAGTVEEETLNALNVKLKAAGKPEVTILIYPTDTDAVDQLRVGRADATLHDSPVAAYYAALNPAFEVAIANFESAPEGIAVAKANPEMTTAIGKAIKAMSDDGTTAAILKKWGIK